MLIQLASPSQLKATWPKYPRATHDEIVRRLKTINGAEFDREEKCWWIPTSQGDRMIDLFPKASYDVGAIWTVTDAETNRVGVFYASLMGLHVELSFDESGAIVAVGDAVSPHLRELITQRADALRPLVMEAQAQPRKAPRAQPERPIGPLTETESGWESWLTGVHNAAAKEEADKVKYPKRPRRKASKPKQGDLGI